MKHKLKKLSKIMTVCTKPMEPDGEFCLQLHEYNLREKELIGDLDLLASVTTRREILYF